MKKLPLIHFTLFAALVAVGCSGAGQGPTQDDPEPSPPSSEPIVHGKADPGDPAVVAIDIGGLGLCSGSLVAPTWVLTARHCVSETAESVSCPSKRAQVSTNREADTLSILVGSDAQSARLVAIGKRLVVPESNQLCDHDIALIELDRPVTGVKPLLVAEGDVPKVGSFVRAVGYGKRGDYSGAGKKYARDHIRVLGRSASEFVVGESTCNGDSGGPALDELGAVVGVVSRGGPGCEGPDAENIYTRVTAFRAFLAQAIGSTGSACSSAHHCPKGYHCGSAHQCEPAK